MTVAVGSPSRRLNVDAWTAGSGELNPASDAIITVLADIDIIGTHCAATSFMLDIS
jgi:hypothetical protein